MVSNVRYSRDPEQQRKFNLEARYQEQETRRAEQASHGPITPSQAHTVPQPSAQAPGEQDVIARLREASNAPHRGPTTQGPGNVYGEGQQGYQGMPATGMVDVPTEMSMWEKIKARASGAFELLKDPSQIGPQAQRAEPTQAVSDIGFAATLALPGGAAGKGGKLIPDKLMRDQIIRIGSKVKALGVDKWLKQATPEHVQNLMEWVAAKTSREAAEKAMSIADESLTAGYQGLDEAFNVEHIDKAVNHAVKIARGKPTKLMLAAQQAGQTALTEFEEEVVKAIKKEGKKLSTKSLQRIRRKWEEKLAEKISVLGGGRKETILKELRWQKVGDRAKLVRKLTSPTNLAIGIGGLAVGGAVSVAGISGIMTWYAIDNIMTGQKFYLQDVQEDLENEDILPEDALDAVEESMDTIETATTSVDFMTSANPVLWPFKNLIETGVTADENAVALIVSRIKDTIDAIGLEPEEDWRTEYLDTMAERDVIEAGIEQEKRTYYEGKEAESREYWDEQKKAEADIRQEEMDYWAAKDARDAAKTAEERAYWASVMKKKEGEAPSKLKFGLI